MRDTISAIQIANSACRISGNYTITVRERFRDNGSSPNNREITQNNAWHDRGIGTQPTVVADTNGRWNMLPQIVHVMICANDHHIGRDLSVISDPDSAFALQVTALHQSGTGINAGIDVLNIVNLTVWADRPVRVAIAADAADFLHEPKPKRRPILIVDCLSKKSEFRQTRSERNWQLKWTT